MSDATTNSPTFLHQDPLNITKEVHPLVVVEMVKRKQPEANASRDICGGTKKSKIEKMERSLELPTIDGPGEHSSRVSLGTGSAAHNSHHAASEASQILQTVLSELMRLRRSGKFSWNLLEEYSVAWQKELDTGPVFGNLFLSASDQEKIKLTKRVFRRQRIA